MSQKAEKTILHLIDTTGPGGAETVFIQLADLLRQQGYRSLVVIRGPGWVNDELQRRGIQPVLMDAKGSFAAAFLLRLFRLAKREKVELIQSHLLGSNVYAAMLGSMLRKPVVATYHGMVDVNPNERFRRLKNKVMQWGISRYVAVSHRLAEGIREQKLLDPVKTEIIYNGVDANRYGRPRSDELRRRLALPEDAVVVGCLGNVRPAKAYDRLIEAAAILAKRQPGFHFVIAGHKKPSLMAKLEADMARLGVSDRVHFIGFIDDTAEYLAQLDYFLLSSRSEGFSISTIEAMMSGLPVVVTRCGGPEEIVTHGKTGWMVEPENPEAIADALQNLQADPNLVQRLAQGGQRHARSTFGIQAMVDGYLEVYRSIEASPQAVQFAAK